MSDPLRAALTRRLKPAVDARERDSAFSGTVLVTRAAEPVFAGAWGYACRGCRTPNVPETQFATASVTKIFTATAILQLVAAGRLKGGAYDAAVRQLAICEGSDWFWWFGDYNPSGTVSDFDRLYRINLSRLYQILGKEPPTYLAEVISHGSGDPAMGGTMRPGQASMA